MTVASVIIQNVFNLDYNSSANVFAKATNEFSVATIITKSKVYSKKKEEQTKIIILVIEYSVLDTV